jgi:hypothetical protein
MISFKLSLGNVATAASAAMKNPGRTLMNNKALLVMLSSPNNFGFKGNKRKRKMARTANPPGT